MKEMGFHGFTFSRLDTKRQGRGIRCSLKKNTVYLEITSMNNTLVGKFCTSTQTVAVNQRTCVLDTRQTQTK